MSEDESKPTWSIDVVIKFGGSAVTDKSRLETLKPEALDHAARLVAQCREKQLTCVVVHGAGSFGHHQAKQYEVNKGWNHLGDPEAVARMKKGLCLTRQSVTKLHHNVIEALLKEDVPAVGLSYFSLWSKDDGNLTQYDLAPLRRVIQSGLVPVLHGDCVFDTTHGCAILSGDTIIKTISKDMSVHRVVFLTDVAGVYNEPPDTNPDAELQTLLYVKDGHLIHPAATRRSSGDGNGVVSDCKEHDVTGGMTLKLQTAIDVVTQSGGQTAVYVCRLTSDYATMVCLNGLTEGSKVVEGTKIEALPVTRDAQWECCLGL